MQTRSHELVRILGGHLGVQLHIQAAQVPLESKSRGRSSALVAAEQQDDGIEQQTLSTQILRG
jgi:hypothetical protein